MKTFQEYLEQVQALSAEEVAVTEAAMKYKYKCPSCKLEAYSGVMPDKCECGSKLDKKNIKAVGKKEDKKEVMD